MVWFPVFERTVMSAVKSVSEDVIWLEPLLNVSLCRSFSAFESTAERGQVAVRSEWVLWEWEPAVDFTCEVVVLKRWAEADYLVAS